MKEPELCFVGGFVKGRFTERNYLTKMGYNVGYSEEQHKAAEELIISRCGQKERYTLGEVASFFLSEYSAYCIPWEHLLPYVDTSEMAYTPLPSGGRLADDETRPFAFNKGIEKGHKVICIVFDTVWNKSLRERFEGIHTIEKILLDDENERLERIRTEVIKGEIASEEEANCRYMPRFHSNPIVVLEATADDEILAATCYGGGYLGKIMSIPEIQYQLAYFGEHC